MPRQIVIDKGAFIALMGREFDALCDFAGSHFVLLSDTLLYECATATRQDPRTLLRKLKGLMDKGGHFCRASISLLKREAARCEPYPANLVDWDATKEIRGDLACLEEMPDSDILRLVAQSRNEVAQVEPVQRSQQLKEAIDREHPETVAVSKAYQANRSDRLNRLLAAVDRMSVHDLSIALLPARLVGDPKRFCLSPDWIAWQYVRLAVTIMYDYHYIRQTGVSRDRHAEHDRQDIDYVLLLSRADAIITQDRGLTELARAAFPEKDVFSSLEEVPESYRCD
jgi:hypothetical protein